MWRFGVAATFVVIGIFASDAQARDRVSHTQDFGLALASSRNSFANSFAQARDSDLTGEREAPRQREITIRRSGEDDEREIDRSVIMDR